MSIEVQVSGLNTEVDVEFASAEGLTPEMYVALRGEKGDTGATGAAGQNGTNGADGADGYSPTATVTKVGDTATISITDINGTTTASISDGASGTSAFICEAGTTTYADAKDAYDNGETLVCTVDDNGNTMVLQLAYFDATDEVFSFAVPNGDGTYYTTLSNADGWDDGTVYFASTDTATTLANGLMSYSDKSKLDTIASGAGVNVQSDWNQSTATADDYIKNKPSIPTITDTYSGTSSDGMSGKAVKSAIDALDGTVSGSAGSSKTLTAFSQTDGKVSATFGNISITKSQVSDFPAIPTNTSDLYNDVPYSTVSCTRHVFSGTKIATLSIDGGSLELFAPSGGGGVTDVTLDGTSVVTGGVAELTSPTIPSKTSDLVNDSLYARGHIGCFHGSCSTGAATAVKAVTCADFTAADLVAGALICVSFSETNSAAVADLCLNVNGTGAYHIKRNGMGTIGNLDSAGYLKNNSYLFYFDGTYWVIAAYYYNSNTDTIAYSVRTTDLQLPLKTQMYRYRLCFTSADGEYFVPANSSTSTSSTTSKTVTTEKIDPWGRIIYYGSSTAAAANAYPTAAYLWSQYNGIYLGYSFNRTGSALTMTAHKPIYVKCAPQNDGSAIIDADTPFVQALPTTADGKIYIFLGIATDATLMEMTLEHPVYYYSDGQIRLWTNAPSGGGGGVTDVTLDGTSVVSGGVAVLTSPTIPTVNDATLTIQKNSTTVASFTANASSNVTADISVPTDTGDLTNGAGFLDKSGILNLFYPVGSYYETSDTSFDPNNSWGGTWSLETEGLVHIGAGSNYTAGSTGGSADAIVPYHRHSVSAVSAAITGGSHSHQQRGWYGVTGNSGTVKECRARNTVSSDAADASTNIASTHTHDLPAHNTNYAGTDGNAVGANMQPYIVVNRWHRTA